MTLLVASPEVPRELQEPMLLHTGWTSPLCAILPRGWGRQVWHHESLQCPTETSSSRTSECEGDRFLAIHQHT